MRVRSRRRVDEAPDDALMYEAVDHFILPFLSKHHVEDVDRDRPLGAIRPSVGLASKDTTPRRDRRPPNA